jgi:hypothetical protein
MARADPTLDDSPPRTRPFVFCMLIPVVSNNPVPLRPEGGLKRKIFRLFGLGNNRKSHAAVKETSPPSPQADKRRKSRILGIGSNSERTDSERLQHVRESKVRQPLDTGDAGSIVFSSTTSLQHSAETAGGGGVNSPVISGMTGTTEVTTPNETELGQFDSATTSNTSSTQSPLETVGTSNKPESTISQTTAATSFSHVTRPVSATPILLPPHTPASPVAPSTASLHPRMTDDASVLTLASSSKRVRRRNSFDTNASMLAIAPSSRRDSQESLQEFDSSEGASLYGPRRSVGSVLSSKFEGGRARSIATGHSIKVGEGEEDEEEEETGESEATEVRRSDNGSN